MTNLYPYLKLARWPNLLMIALTQYLTRYFLLGSLYEFYEADYGLSEGNFFLLVLSTLCIAAAGYIINDYFDVRADTVNTPDQVIIGTHISKTTARYLYFALSIVGVVLGVLVGWQVGNYNLGLIHIVCVGLLWFYSESYKRQFLVGNVVIGMLTALVVLMVGFYERQIYTAFIEEEGQYRLALSAMIIILSYSFFAFMVTFLREIVKDMRDTEGDAQISGKTLPLVLGIEKTKWIVGTLMLGFIGSIGYLQYLLETAWLRYGFITIAVQLPLLMALYFLMRGRKNTDFRYVSGILKGVMVVGIGSMILFNYWLLG